MTEFSQSWESDEEARRAWFEENGLYRSDDEHSSCGAGRLEVLRLPVKVASARLNVARRVS